MLNLVISNNAGTTRDIVADTTPIIDICEQYGLSVARGGIMVNGATLSAAQMTQTPKDLGITGTLFLSQYAKLDNA